MAQASAHASLRVALNNGGPASANSDRDTGRAAGPAPSGEGAGGVRTKVMLAIAVVTTGCANNISKQIAAKPLAHYTYMLGLATAVAYLPLFGAVLLALLRAGAVPRYQLDFVWRARASLPYIAYFALAALGDAVGDVVGMICTPYVSGPVHSLLSNCTVMFIAAFSLCVLGSRYSLHQCLGLLGVFVAVVLGVLPSFGSGGAGKTDPFFAVVLGAFCVFNAVSFIIKEWIFRRYKAWAAEAGHSGADGQGAGLHVFVVNTHAALFQLPLTLLIVPLNEAFGQTGGEGLASYLGEAFACVFGDPKACGQESHGAEWAGLCVLVYVFFNVLWNVSILLSVKHSGALATFVALKAIFPVSTILFACVDWPLLGTTKLSWLVWLSVALMLPSIAVYQWASDQQSRRREQDPSLAACCWPLLRHKRMRPRARP